MTAAKPNLFLLTHHSNTAHTLKHLIHPHTAVDTATSVDIADYFWRQYQQRYMTHSRSEELPMVFQSIWVNGVRYSFSISSLTISHSNNLFILPLHINTHRCGGTSLSKLTYPAVGLPSFNDLMFLLSKPPC